jgi:hypothetical protein
VLSPVLGRDVSASEGKINAIRDAGRGFQFDADVNPGNSGGPLLNDPRRRRRRGRASIYILHPPFCQGDVFPLYGVCSKIFGETEVMTN